MIDIGLESFDEEECQRIIEEELQIKRTFLEDFFKENINESLKEKLKKGQSISINFFDDNKILTDPIIKGELIKSFNDKMYDLRITPGGSEDKFLKGGPTIFNIIPLFRKKRIKSLNNNFS